MEEYKEKFFDFAASGDVDNFQKILKGIVDVNIKNEGGWTALMFAARNGHANIVHVLLDKGCDPFLLNANGQSALDISKFWNNSNVVELLSPSVKPSSPLGDIFLPQREVINYFSNSTLDRSGYRRKDSAWLDCAKTKQSSIYILLHQLRPVVAKEPKAERFSLCNVSYNQIQKEITSNTLVIFLGEDIHTKDENGIPWFAIDISHIRENEMAEKWPNAELLPLMPNALRLDKSSAAIFGQARSIMAWHERYQFCPTCGSCTVVEDAGYKRTCTDSQCISRKGVHNTCYPRLDPTVIVAIISPNGQSILLGQHVGRANKMWTCLSGFMEPGESIEEACRREVMEESGVKVGRISYHSSQPWPMPASMMIGCIGFATSTDIKVDKEELEDVKWFSKEDCLLMINFKHPVGYWIPPEEALASTLIRAWINMISPM